MQVSELSEYVNRRGFALVGTYIDIASGSCDERPQLAKVMQLAKQRKIDTLLVWKLDRLGRSLKLCPPSLSFKSRRASQSA